MADGLSRSLLEARATLPSVSSTFKIVNKFRSGIETFPSEQRPSVKRTHNMRVVRLAPCMKCIDTPFMDRIKPGGVPP